ncbi:MAG: hypothetical protein H0X12_09590 [Nocardioides sp.]|nr:hypothetical protein [Nocardioides sp.]
MSYEQPPPYSPPPAPGPRWDLGEALTYGWNKLQSNISQLVLAMLVLFVGVVATVVMVGVLQWLLLDSGEAEFNASTGEVRIDEGSGFLTVLVVNALISALALVVLQVFASGLIRGALGITEGREFKTAEMLKTDKIWPVFVTSLIVGALTFAGTLLCYVPGLVVGFLTSYSLYFVLDKGLAPTDAVKASVSLVKDNIGPALLWYVVGGFVALAGLLACGVGALLTVPVVLIGTAYTYKMLTGAPVAP